MLCGVTNVRRARSAFESPGSSSKKGEHGKLGHREIERPESIGHRVVQDRLRPLYQVAHPGHRDPLHAHLTISLPDIISGYLR
jgi:hypothetical protein